LAFSRAYFKCTPVPEIAATEYWVWISNTGKQAKLFTFQSGGLIIESSIDPAFARRFIQE